MQVLLEVLGTAVVVYGLTFGAPWLLERVLRRLGVPCSVEGFAGEAEEDKRDCHVASLLAMTGTGGCACCGDCHGGYAASQ